jgi:uncharacterized membrane protein
MRGAALIPVLLVGVGLFLVADAVLRGTASVALVVIFPVVYGGAAEFLIGVVVLLVGFLSLPLAFGGRTEISRADDGVDRGAHSDAPTFETTGLLLIGPFPTFWGEWKNVARPVKWAVAAVGALLVVAAIVFWVLR